MPWHIDEDGKGKCVIKDSTGETVKCHDTHEEAVAHMRALYAREGKSADVKIGRTISNATLTKIQAAHDTLAELGAACQKKSVDVEEIPVDIEKSVINYGGTVKALADNKIGGYLVTFGNIDLTGDYFTPETDFGEYGKLPVLYHHGFDERLKTRRLGTAEVKEDEVGLWAEAQLSMRDEYEKMVYELAKAGKLGWSSGAAAHVATREQDTKGMKITQWYMAEASLTPCPAEPHNTVIPLKAFLGVTQTETEPKPEAEAAQPAQKAEGQAEVKTIQGVETMELTPEQLQEITDKAANAALKAFVAAQPSEKPAEVQVTVDEADNALKGGWKSPGEFFQAVKSAAITPHKIDRRLLPLEVKAGQGLNESIPSEGGFLVDSSISPGIFERMYDQGTLLGQFAKDTLGPNSNGMTYNIVDETSRADGSRWGGLQGYWLGEGGTKTASHPTFSQLELKLKKVAALCYATDELLGDASALESWLTRTVPKELQFMVEDAILNGSGVGKPRGCFNQGGPFIQEPRTVASLAALTAAEIASVWSRRWVGAKDYIWLVDQSILPGLMGLTIGNFPVFMPPNGLQGTPASMLFGRPVFEVEYLPTLATTTGPMGLFLMAPSQYAIIDKGGVQSASSIHVSFVTDETAFRFVYRIDGAPMWETTLTPHAAGAEVVSPFVALGSTSS